MNDDILTFTETVAAIRKIGGDEDILRRACRLIAAEQGRTPKSERDVAEHIFIAMHEVGMQPMDEIDLCIKLALNIAVMSCKNGHEADMKAGLHCVLDHYWDTITSNKPMVEDIAKRLGLGGTRA